LDSIGISAETKRGGSMEILIFSKIIVVMDTFDWTYLSQLICTSVQKDKLIIFNNIKKLMFYYNI